MGQRGSVRIESGSYYGYWNQYISEDKDGELTKVRRQKCVKLGPAEGVGKLSKWDAQEALAKEITKANGGSSKDPVRDGSITLEKFTNERWKPMRGNPSGVHPAGSLLSTRLATSSRNSAQRLSISWTRSLCSTGSMALRRPTAEALY